MIPVWLTPKVIKGIGIGLIVAAFFTAGYRTSSKINSWRLEKVKAEYATLLQNNRQCLDQNLRASKSISELEAALEEQGDAINKLAEDSRVALQKQQEKHRLALERYRRSSEASVAKLEADKQELLERMEILTVCESCNEAWREVVK